VTESDKYIRLLHLRIYYYCKNITVTALELKILNANFKIFQKIHLRKISKEMMGFFGKRIFQVKNVRDQCFKTFHDRSLQIFAIS